MNKILYLVVSLIIAIFADCTSNKVTIEIIPDDLTPTQEDVPTNQITPTVQVTPFATATIDPVAGWYEEDKIFINRSRANINLRNRMNGDVVGVLPSNQYFIAWGYYFDRQKTTNNMWLYGCRANENLDCNFFSVYVAEWLLEEVNR